MALIDEELIVVERFTMAMDNGDYYRRFLSGDKEGMEELVAYYRKGLMLYLLSITGNIDQAEDFAEDTFLELYVNRPVFTGESSFKTWLYSIGRHKANRFFRRKARFVFVPYDDDCVEQKVMSLEEAYIKDQERIALHKAISALKKQQRQVIYLSYFECLKNEEIAQIMRKSARQIENLLYYAKKCLREELERMGYTHGQR